MAEGLASLGFTGSFVAALSVVMFLACVVCRATAGPSVAPTSARDDGPTLPIESFLAERQPDGPQTELVSDMAVVYPVSNPGLRAGTPIGSASMPAAYAAWLTHPIALIGDDANSRRWLTQQGDALNALGASILVVQVKSLERMRALRAHRPELAMAPARVPELVAVLRGKICESCSICAGAGHLVLGGNCAQCGGSGAVPKRSWFGWPGARVECEACLGGGIARQPCQACAGTGKSSTHKYKVSVRIPHGVRHGDRLHVDGQGRRPQA